MMSHRPLNRKSPHTASRSSEKWQKHSKHTTGNGLQTLFRFLGILHGKLTIYILDRISAPYKQLTLRFGYGGCKLQVAGCRLQVAGCRLQVQVAGASCRCRLQVQVAGAGCRLQVAGAGCRLQVAGCRL